MAGTKIIRAQISVPPQAAKCALRTAARLFVLVLAYVATAIRSISNATMERSSAMAIYLSFPSLKSARSWAKVRNSERWFTGYSTGPHLHYERRDARGNLINSTEELGVQRGQQIEGGTPIHPPPEQEERAAGRPQMPLSDPQEAPLKPQSTADQLPFKVAGGELPPRVSKENAYAPGKMYESTAPIDPPAQMKGQDKGDMKPKDPKDYEYKYYELRKTPEAMNEPKKEEQKSAPKKEDTKEG